jgi:hypothetical protein
MVPDEEETEEEEDVFEVAKKLAKAEVAKELKKKEKEITARVENDLKPKHEKAIEELRVKMEKRENELQAEAKRIEGEMQREAREQEKRAAQIESQMNELRGRENDLRKELESIKAEYTKFREKAEADLAAKEGEIKQIKQQTTQEREKIESSFFKREGMLQAEVADARKRIDEARKDAEERIAKREVELKEKIDVEREKVKMEFQASLAQEEKKISDEITEKLNKEHAKREVELRKEMEDAIRRKEGDMRATFEAERIALERERERRIEGEVKKAEEALRAKVELESKNREERVKETLSKEMEAKRKEFEAEVKARMEKEKDSQRAILELEYKRREDMVRQHLESDMVKREDEIKKKAIADAGGSMPASASLIRKGLAHSIEPCPFSAIVGQERAKRALILNAVNPTVGGILLWGEEGNGKTLMMTSFAHLLDGMKKSNGSAMLPWNSDDRYIAGVFPSTDTVSYGTVDTEMNIGVLSRARKGKDPNEIRFMLDTMSRGHFEILEAFRRMAMHIRVDPLSEPNMRMEVAKRLRDHIADPKKLRKDFDQEERQLKERILKARDGLPKVSLPSKISGKIAQICHLKELPMKMDFLISELARTNAAFEGRESVSIEDVQDAADLVLAYRTDEKLMKMLKTD